MARQLGYKADCGAWALGMIQVLVEEELYERYGDIILAAPRAEGFGTAAYAIPILALARPSRNTAEG